ncbi:hypothetical protein [Duganella sp. FT27W]|uniref:hypothetical protein n=1 Tax=Duganella sp. FT27W TaxID=2654636 RepID=UPI00186B9559|nr:hypothetical protein [Duganella sp. FT27W]
MKAGQMEKKTAQVFTYHTVSPQGHGHILAVKQQCKTLPDRGMAMGKSERR